MTKRKEWDAGDLRGIAEQSMIDHGLVPDFPAEVEREVAAIEGAAGERGGAIRDLRDLLWCSIDNDDSRDLDQLTVAQSLPGGSARILIAIADVDALAGQGSAVDEHAAANTTSVYTAARVFPMLPERLSTDLTSLNEGVDRLAVVVEMEVSPDGEIISSSIYRALVHNKTKLAYNRVAEWIEGRQGVPSGVSSIEGLAPLIELQDEVAQKLRELRHLQGALQLDTIEPRARVVDGRIVDIHREKKNRAKELIEDFMIAANGATARFLRERGFATIRRVVREPSRWARIVMLASEHGEQLPPEPDSVALERFLASRRKADPDRFPDLSLSVVKLMGAGEYAVELPGATPTGHFGLAVRDYAHSTAPNRRYPDLITQRLLKAALDGKKSPYSAQELGDLAEHCTAQEDAANKVERHVRKSAAAIFLHDRVGQRFDAIVTGASVKGTWVRAINPPIEGRLAHGGEGIDVGDRLRVKLISVDVERGFIDFARTR